MRKTKIALKPEAHAFTNATVGIFTSNEMA